MVDIPNAEDIDVLEICPIAVDEDDTRPEDEDDGAQLQLAERGEFSDDDDDGRVIEEIHYSTPDGKSHRLNKESGPTPPPQVGMIFEDWEAVERYFRSYAKQQGFGMVRAHGSYRQRNGKPTKERRAMTWNCERFGNKDTRRRVNGRKIKLHSLSKSGVKFATRKSKKCQCLVSLYAGAKPDGHWDIRRVVLEHFGHTPAPSKAKYVAMFRQDDSTRVVRKRLFIQMEAGVSLPQIHRSLSKERNGLENTTFTERDPRNVVARKKKLKLDAEGGDANALVNYLKKMHEDNENFFHMERVDEID